MLGKEVLAIILSETVNAMNWEIDLDEFFLSRKNPWIHKAINYTYVEINLVKAFFFFFVQQK